jgi:hypothetical protein
MDIEAIALEVIDTAAELSACAALVESGAVAPSALSDVYAQVLALRDDMIGWSRRAGYRSASYGDALTAAGAALNRADDAHRDLTGDFVPLAA